MPFPNALDLFRIGRDEILARNPKLSREAVERDGADANAMVASGAAMGDEVMSRLADVAAALFLDSAEGEALDRLVYDRYGLTRKPAANALCSVQFSTTEPNPAPFVIPAGTKLSTSDGVEFVTRAVATFDAGSVGPLLVPVRSVLAGADQQIRKFTLTIINGAPAGSPADLEVTNPVASSGAADAERDPNLRERARNFYINARRGTLGAIEQGALAVTGVVRARAFEVLDNLGRPARAVLLMVADDYSDLLAELNQTTPTYQAQSQQLAASVFAGLSNVRAGGIYVQTQVAQVVLQPVRLNLQFHAGVNVDEVAVRARAVVVSIINGLRPGTTLDLEDVRRALQTVPGLAYSGEEILSPAGNVVPTVLQAIRTTLGLVTATAAQSDQTISASTNPDAWIIDEG